MSLLIRLTTITRRSNVNLDNHYNNGLQLLLCPFRQQTTKPALPQKICIPSVGKQSKAKKMTVTLMEVKKTHITFIKKKVTEVNRKTLNAVISNLLPRQLSTSHTQTQTAPVHAQLNNYAADESEKENVASSISALETCEKTGEIGVSVDSGSNNTLNKQEELLNRTEPQHLGDPKPQDQQLQTNSECAFIEPQTQEHELRTQVELDKLISANSPQQNSPEEIELDGLIPAKGQYEAVEESELNRLDTAEGSTGETEHNPYSEHLPDASVTRQASNMMSQLESSRRLEIDTTNKTNTKRNKKNEKEEHFIAGEARYNPHSEHLLDASVMRQSSNMLSQLEPPGRPLETDITNRINIKKKKKKKKKKNEEHFIADGAISAEGSQQIVESFFPDFLSSLKNCNTLADLEDKHFEGGESWPMDEHILVGLEGEPFEVGVEEAWPLEEPTKVDKKGETSAQEPREEDHQKPSMTKKPKKKSHKVDRTSTAKFNKQLSAIRKVRAGRHFNRAIESYLHVCVTVGLVNRAAHTLTYYRNVGDHAMSSALPYNIVLGGFLSKGKYSGLLRLITSLHTGGITPDATTWAINLAMLHNIDMSMLLRNNGILGVASNPSSDGTDDEFGGIGMPVDGDKGVGSGGRATGGVGRLLSVRTEEGGGLLKQMEGEELQPDTEMAGLSICEETSQNDRQLFYENIRRDEIRHLLDTMEKQGLTLDTMFAECDFFKDLRQQALASVRRVLPTFTPTPLTPNTTPGYLFTPLLSAIDCALEYDLSEASAPLETAPELVVSDARVQKQLNCEIQVDIPIASIYTPPPSKQVTFLKRKLVDWQGRWRKSLTNALHAKIGLMKEEFIGNKVEKPMTLYPYMVALPVNQLVDIMMQELKSLAIGSAGSFSSHHLFNQLGLRVYSYYAIKYKETSGVIKKTRKVYGRYANIYTRYAERGMNGRVVVSQLLAHPEFTDGACLTHRPPQWPYSIRKEVGALLYSVMMSSVHVWKPLNTERQKFPALQQVESTSGYASVTEIRTSPLMYLLYRQTSNLHFPFYELPMICPPLPWFSHVNGAYLLQGIDMIRFPGDRLIENEKLAKVPLQQLAPVLDSINQLGCTPWRLNTPLLDLLIKVFNSNSGADLDIPQHPSFCPLPPSMKNKSSQTTIIDAAAGQDFEEELLPQPPQEPTTTPPTSSDTSNTTNKNTSLNYTEKAEYHKLKNEMNSLWCTALYKLSIANHFRDEVIWFPHNVDFRGRAYPYPPHLNHISSDVYRSLLCFAVAKPLGTHGLRWLKIHLINLTGKRKQHSLEDRLQYCEEVMEDILDSANDPLTGRRWWTGSDHPWQTLAACMELRDALLCADPSKYCSRLPIHQDGSCNGLQHYAALGRDSEGATSVNLAPSHVPQDVYTAVARLVEAQRRNDAVNPSSKYKVIASVLEGFITRKVVKQTVMTTVYGVTNFGALLQVKKQLKALNFPESNRIAASSYVAKAVFSSLDQMFTATKDIQGWFTDCARTVSSVRGEKMEWVTPLGLPVVQPYNMPPSARNLSRFYPSLRHYAMGAMDVAHTQRQKNAFPPNFIHSLDACHMMLTSLHCHHSRLSFASVHDCFWTHAASVPTMNLICRDQFVALHSQPILQDLANSLFKRFSIDYSKFSPDDPAVDSARQLNVVLNKVPTLGDFDIDLVKKSTFFFS